MTELRDREEIEKLLLWYVNGTLETAERQQVETFLEEHPEARSQVEFLAKMRDEVKKDEAGSPGEFGLRRLQREMRAAPTVKAASSSVSFKGWRAAAVVAAMVVMIQGALLLDGFRDAGQYTPLGTDTNTPQLQVVFNETAIEAQIRELLQNVGASITSGPGALGIYRLSLDYYQNEEDLDRALKELQMAINIVDEASLD